MTRYFIVPRPRYGFWNFVLDVFLAIVTLGLWLIVVIVRETIKAIRGY
jgi:hypothetical protein